MVAHQYGGTINKQFRALGFGPDWERERFTMDDGLSVAVRRVFVSLYREGLIYRGKRLINWDPKGEDDASPTPRWSTTNASRRCGTCAIRPTAATAST